VTIRTRRSRILAAVVGVLSLALAACGTRLDHDAIVQAARGASGQAVTGSGVPGQGVTPDGLPGADLPGASGVPGADGAAGTAPGAPSARGGSGPGDAGRGGGSGGEPIVVGTVGTFSGPAGAGWKQAPRAVQAWAAMTNAKGGINGRQVKVIVMDDTGDPARGRSQVQELVETHKAIALVSPMVSGPGLSAWKNYVTEKKLPVVGGPGGVGWHDAPTVFANFVEQDVAAHQFADAAARFGGDATKVGGLFCTEDSSCSYLEKKLFDEGYLKQAGLEPVYHKRFSVSQPEFTAECIEARNAGVQLFMVIADPQSVARVASSCRRQNFTPRFVEAATTLNGDSASKPELDGTVYLVAQMPFAGLSTPAFQEFDQAWKKYGGGQQADAAASTGWASAKMFETAARAAGGNISRETVVQQFYRFKNERFGGTTTPLSFTPEGTRPQGCYFIMAIRGGKWVSPNGDKIFCV
jgi:branched-chain amino acid transport system substrate-binding protein